MMKDAVIKYHKWADRWLGVQRSSRSSRIEILVEVRVSADTAPPLLKERHHKMFPRLSICITQTCRSVPGCKR